MGLSCGKSRFLPKALSKEFQKICVFAELYRKGMGHPQDVDYTENIVDSHWGQTLRSFYSNTKYYSIT